MSERPESPAMDRLIDFLGELGPRWGLPAEACRVHALLFLTARPATSEVLGNALELDEATLSDALAWLSDYRLVTQDGDAWRTDSDPWELLLRALQERRRREMGPALDLLRDCHQAALADDADRIVAAQIGKLRTLAEDVAAIEVSAQRLSPRTLRRMVGIGGRAARFMDRTFGGGERT